MSLDEPVEDFLHSIKEKAYSCASIVAGENFVTLVHPFWSFDEIMKARKIQAEWEVSSELIPFYGNWHTLICISHLTGEVQLLDDCRNTLHVWESAEDFLSCLTAIPEREDTSPTESGIIESETWFDF